MKDQGYTFEHPTNRFERRYQKKTHPQQQPLKVQLDNARSRLHQADTTRRVTLSDPRYNDELNRFIFEAPPVISVLIDAMEQFNQVIQAVDRSPLPGINTSKLHRENGYDYKIRGLSLLNIQELSLPLNRDSLSQLNRFFRDNLFSRTRPAHQTIQYLTRLYTVETLLHPNKLSSNPQTKALSKRLHAYFNFYSDFLLSPPDANTQGNLFLLNLSWVGHDFIRTLACYTAVKTGLTPSSTQRLFMEKQESIGNWWWWQYINAFVGDTTRLSHRPGILAASFDEIATYSPRRDIQIADYLLQTQDQLTSPLKSTSLDTLSQINKYRRFIRSEILRSPDQILSFESNHPLVRSLELTVYPEKSTTYQNTILIKHNLASGTPLLVEDAGLDRLFGIPGQLAREIPSIGDHLVQTIIRPAILPVIDKARPAKIELSRPIPTLRITTALPDTFTEEPKSPKVKTRPVFLAGIVSQPELPEQVKTQKPKKFLVQYQLSQLTKLAGKNAAKDEIARLQQALFKFEVGEKEIEALTDIEDHYRLRVGDRRIILRRTSHNVFIPIEVSPRDQAYRGHHIRRLQRK